MITQLCWEIISHYILNTVIIFDLECPTLETFSVKMDTIATKFPSLIAEVDNELIGFAYANTWRTKAAYANTVESTIYLNNNSVNKGVGSALYSELFKQLKARGFKTIVAGATLPNKQSENFHLKHGFKNVGLFKAVGYKFGKWNDVGWFQKML